MKLKLYNTLTNQKEIFVPINQNEVTIYTCGPTVYSYAHIGNMSSYLMADVLIRALELLGYKVKQVKNITDVGHLTSDGDTGEDKMEKEARKQKKDPFEIAAFYTKQYIEDEKVMKLKEAFARPKATEFINEMIEMVKVLIDKDLAYETSDGVYIDISKIPNYGQLSGNKVEELNAGARVEVNTEKKHPADFAVWKKAEENHIMQWDSPWGKSFPGWHLECSAMAWNYFQNTYDIKTGGEDNIFPHHECEIAQTWGVYGKKLANYYVHKRHINLDGIKMSKSKGNIVNVQDLLTEGFSPEAIRLSLISSHYRNRLNFTKKLIEESQKNIEKINELIQKLLNIKKETGIDLDKDYENTFLSALCDDLNMPEALSVMHELVKFSYKNIENLSQIAAEKIIDTLKSIDTVLKCFSFDKKEKIEIPEDIKKLAEGRLQAKKLKDYNRADMLRDEIQKLGYKIVDIKESYEIEIL